MEPNNIDNTIREKLNSREIKPSAQSWDRLDAMLSVSENKKAKKRFPFFKTISIAASVVLFATVGFWLYNQNTQTVILNNNNVVVTNDTINKNSSITNESSKEIIQPLQIISKSEVLVENGQIEKTKIDNKNTTSKNADVAQTKENNTAIAVLNTNKEVIEKTVVKQTNKNISAETLLASLDKEVFTYSSAENTKSISSIKINANSLLSTAESEINKEYRATNLDKIVKNFREVKSSLANRNYEE